MTWDPLCTFSCYHGATTVIIGNCSLALAPVRRGTEERLAEFLSYVEAIPMEALKTVDMTWETIAEYMATLDKRLGVNVGNLIGHTAVRHYVMGNESQGRAATAAEIEAMRGIVRDGIKAGALGLSVSTGIKGTTIPRASIFRRSGPRRTRSLRSATCWLSSEPASSRVAADARPSWRTG